MKRICIIIILLLLCVVNQVNAAWEDAESRTYYCTITVQSSQVDATLSHFPLLLDATNFPANMMDSDETEVAQSGGGDIRFSTTAPTAEDGTGATQIPCEIVAFTPNSNPASASVEIWIDSTSISSVADTTLYCAWGTSGSSSQPIASHSYGSDNVWSSDFKLVSHNGGLTDSTSNSNDGTGHGGISGGGSAGKIGVGTLFDGGDDYFDCGSDASIDGLTTRTVSAWVNMSDTTAFRTFAAKVNGTANGWTVAMSHTLGVDTVRTLADVSRWSTTDGIWRGPTDALSGTGSWKHVATTYDSGSTANDVVLYIDGSSVSVTEYLTPDGTLEDDSAYALYIGARGPTAALFMNGYMDDVRVSSEVKATTWVSTEYNNQSSPSTFVVEGAIQTFAAATFTPQIIFFQ